ncbi:MULTISPECIES: superoxide dismutase family protein [unclassified Devosia]|uniref:superoxide dismutase family protein n=1 Tax=unclassified Devosia TaxID=196773 RepID=UPI00155456CE|nr:MULTISPECIES: superoxide dismutase family protein [unclassified Devosia]
MRRLVLISAFALAAALPAQAQDTATAAATFIDASGNEVGSVTLTQDGDAVSIVGHVMDITPGEHGLHFHETGDCDASTAFESAGSHFNPTEHQHGTENPEGPHAGDLPNITADADGMADIELSTEMISLEEGDDAYVFDDDGTALVIHASADDYKTDPSGNSGDRIACAVIEATAE